MTLITCPVCSGSGLLHYPLYRSDSCCFACLGSRSVYKDSDFSQFLPFPSQNDGVHMTNRISTSVEFQLDIIQLLQIYISDTFESIYSCACEDLRFDVTDFDNLSIFLIRSSILYETCPLIDKFLGSVLSCIDQFDELYLPHTNHFYYSLFVVHSVSNSIKSMSLDNDFSFTDIDFSLFHGHSDLSLSVDLSELYINEVYSLCLS